MDSSGAHRIYFDTDTLPERDRFPAFCEEVARCYIGLDLTTEDRSQFRASVELQRVGSIGVGRNATSRVASARTSRLVNDGDDSLLVTLLEDGLVCQTQCSDAQRLSAGDAIMSDCGYPGELNIVAESRFWNLKVPRRSIAGLFPHATHFAGVKLDNNVVARRLLFSYVAATADIELERDRDCGFVGRHAALRPPVARRNRQKFHASRAGAPARKGGRPAARSAMA